MRSTNEIIIAVKDCEPCTDKELRLAVVALSGMQIMDRMATRQLAKAIIEGTSSATLRAKFFLQEDEIRFKSMKMPVDEYLGQSNIPGTPENDYQMRLAKNIFKKATGLDL